MAPEIIFTASGNKVSIKPKYSDLAAKKAIVIRAIDISMFNFSDGKWVISMGKESGNEMDKESFFAALIHSLKLEE